MSTEGVIDGDREWFSNDENLIVGLRNTCSHWANVPEIPGYDELIEMRRGGQGVVYRAWQRSTKRFVAIKVLVDGTLASDQNRLRFRREIELAGALDHPNIVRVYDSGVTGEGQLYYVMELVDGLPLDEACAKHGYALRKTLEVFAAVCNAVEHAHRRGIIHRDLKPGNILIDGHGSPHVLDFGLAKIAPESGGARALSSLSRTGQFLGSLAFASPEQIEKSPDLVDLRTDVYSLGVILYRLVTGQLPHTVSNTLRHTVCQVTTAPPPNPRSVRRGIPDDVETIVLRCLAKEPERRYQTASDLERDLERYLAGEPIEAKRDRPLYVLRKTLARHKSVTALILLLLLVLVGFGLTMTVLYRRAASAEESARANLAQALTQTAKAEAVREFLQDMLSSSDPLVSRGRSLTVRQMLDAASRTISGRFSDHPEVEAEIRSVMGAAYYVLGHLDEAEEHGRRALALMRGLYGEDHLEVAQGLRNLGVVATDRRRFDDAETLLQKALRITRGLVGEDHVQTADCLVSLAELRQTQFRFQEAHVLFSRACETYREQCGLADQRSLAALVQWSGLLLERGKFAPAEEKLNQVLNALGNHSKQCGPIRCGALLNLGIAQFNTKDFAAAETTLEEAIRCQQQVFGDEHPRLSAMFNYMGHLRRDQHRFSEAEVWYRKSLEVCEKLTGRDSPQGASALWNLAQSRWYQGDHDSAEPLFREAIAIRSRLFTPEHHLAQASLTMFAQLLGKAGQWKKAVPLLEEVARTRSAQYGEKHPLTARAKAKLGEGLTELGRFEESEPVLLKAHAVLAAAKNARPDHLEHVLSCLVRLYTQWGKPDAAKKYRALRAERD